MTTNLVYVPMIQTGCFKAEFDSTFPIQLNGIISQNDFRESVEKINRASFSTQGRLIIRILYAFSMVISIIFIIYGAMHEVDSDGNRFPLFAAIGMGIGIVVTIIFTIVVIIMRVRRERRMREVIAEESMKYLGRSRSPCNWKLGRTRFFGGYGSFSNSYGSNTYHVSYHLIIDISRLTSSSSDDSSNQGAKDNESSYLTGQYNQCSPPSYSSI